MATVKATQSVFIPRFGRSVSKGETFKSDHPIVAAYRELFVPTDAPDLIVDQRADFEQATAAPGETRNVVRCPVDGCDYAGTARGLAIHTGAAHKGS